MLPAMTIPEDTRRSGDRSLGRVRIGTRRRPDVVLEIPEFHFDEHGDPVPDADGEPSFTIHEFRIRGFLTIPEQRQVLHTAQRVQDATEAQGTIRTIELVDAVAESHGLILSFVRERHPDARPELFRNLEADEVVEALNLIATGRRDRSVEQEVADALTEGQPTLEQMMAADPEEAQKLLDEIKRGQDPDTGVTPLVSTTPSTTD